MYSSFEVNNAMCVKPYLNGITILLPNANIENKYPKVADLLSLPFCVYFTDLKTLNFSLNDCTAEICGYASLKEATGSDLFKVLKRNVVDEICYHYQQMAQTRDKLIVEEACVRQDGFSYPAFSIKIPLYLSDKIIGALGFTIILGQQPLLKALESLMALKLFNAKDLINCLTARQSLSEIPLTHREYDCIKLYVRGKSAKEVGRFLQISNKTVEAHLDNIKKKLNVRSKSELIDSVLTQFNLHE